MKEERFYRKWHNARLQNMTICYRETDLMIRLPRTLTEPELKSLQQIGLELVQDLWEVLEGFSRECPEFKESLVPVELPEGAPDEAAEMARAARAAGVGPLAAVAGFFAQRVGEEVLKKTGEVIVENGGDIFLDLEEEGLVGIYAGPDSPFTGRLGLKVRPEMTPLGICTSAGSVGPSLSLGQADAVIVLSQSTPLADAAATAVGNLVKTAGDIENALEQSRKIAGVTGVVIIKDEHLGAWGQVEFVRMQESRG